MFIDISDRLFHNPPAWHNGIAVLDFDADGQFEFFVTAFQGPNRVLKWINGGLIDVSPPGVADSHRQSIAAAAADLDGNGREEIYVVNVESKVRQQRDRLWSCLPDGQWVDLFERPEARAACVANTGRSVAVLDRRGNGRYGFVLSNYGLPLRFFEWTPASQVTDIAPALGINLVTAGRGLIVAPLTSDRPDLYCSADRGTNYLFRNTGIGTFAEVAGVYGLADEAELGRGITALDADGDGRIDLCFGNWDGPHRLMTRKSDGTFRNRASPAMAFPSMIRNVIAADFDNDGYEELFFNNHGESNRLFKASRQPHLSNELLWQGVDIGAASEDRMTGTGAAVADIDNDGRLELLVAHGEGDRQPLTLYKMPANENEWLRVRPLTRFGAPARGAVVRLIERDRKQIRVIDGGSGYLCQQEPVAHFGLGLSPQIESLSITWPDGTIATIEEPPVNGTLYVRYPGETADVIRCHRDAR